MGADGWIDIYDAEIAEQHGLLEKLREMNIAQMYERTIFDKRVITIYSETEREIYDERYPFDGRGYSGSKMTPDEIKLFRDLQSLCFIDTWEVWT